MKNTLTAAALLALAAALPAPSRADAFQQLNVANAGVQGPDAPAALRTSFDGSASAPGAVQTGGAQALKAPSLAAEKVAAPSVGMADSRFDGYPDEQRGGFKTGAIVYGSALLNVGILFLATALFGFYPAILISAVSMLATGLILSRIL